MTNTFETGGSERQYVILAKSLSPERYDLHLGCVNRRGPFAVDFPDVPEYKLGGSLYGWKSVRTRLDLARDMRRARVQIAHAFDFYSCLTMIPAARLAGVPIVIGAFRQLGDLLTTNQFRAQAAVLRWCHAVICNSQAGLDRLAADGLSRDKMFVIGNALLPEVFAAATPVLPRRPGVPRVGMVARMNAAYKNHSGFLRIAAQVHRQCPDVEFLLAGDGPLRLEIEREAEKLGLGERVIFLGDRRDIPAVHASMDIAVLTSDSEGLSNVILEAMAAGLPVIAYDVGGNRELVNDQRGALIAPGDETRFADALQKLLRQPALRQQQGVAARRFAEEKFSLDRVRQSYEERYATLLEKKGLRSPAAR